MKKIEAMHSIAVIALAAIFLTAGLLVSCGDSPGGGDIYYTVTFATPNATPPAKVTVLAGSKITQPRTPDKNSDGYNAKLTKWNTNIAVAWDFDNDSVYEDMTLTAVWAPYTAGEKGPAGGTIVRASSTKFSRGFYYNPSRQPEKDCYYLECAPLPLSYSQIKWASNGKENTDIPNTYEDIGLGMRGTWEILTKDPNAPAAKYCADYSSGGRYDWFLPSPDELLCVRNHIDIAAFYGYLTVGYWTSYQPTFEPTLATWIEMKSGAINTQLKSLTASVLPMRAF